MESKLEALQSHFTWDLDSRKSKLFRLRDKLEDIGTEEGNSWLGHIYNLQGFIHYQLGFIEEAQSFFSRATEAFHQMRNTVSDGPWLVVNYGNLAWMHHHLGERAKSEEYLSKVHALMNEYPPPSEDELHPEIYAEKAWTLMKFCTDKNLLAADYFQRAIRMWPDRVEWQTSRVLALVNASNQCGIKLGDDILEEMKHAKEHDPENLYLAALYLEACAQRGTNIKEEARELAENVLRKPVSSYSGFTPLLRLYRLYVSMDEAINLAEEALERHPDECYLKRCAANCYTRKIFSKGDNPLDHNMIDKAISLLEEVISLYPHSSLKTKIFLANIYAKTNDRQAVADQIYDELLESDLDLRGKQMLYNFYAKYLYFSRDNSRKSIEYHMKAAEIEQQSSYREDSIKHLKKTRDRRRSSMCGEIVNFLGNLHPNKQHINRMNRDMDSKSPDQSYMMSAAQTQPTLEAKLEALQSHFTWDLDSSTSTLFSLRDKLEDIGKEGGSSWLGHIYNLQGFIHYQLGFIEEAQSFFSRATEAFHQMRNTVSDGPWLVVNYGNLAWMHHHLGERAKSEEYLSKVHTLMNEYPSPSEDELHPEIYAEKAWTLMKFCADKKLLAADYFQRAIRMQPDRVEWQTSRVLALVNAFMYRGIELGDDILEEMEKAKEHDPENLYLAALYLEACAQRGTDIEEEARELAEKVLRKTVSSYSGFTPLLRLYRLYVSMDEAINLAEEALERHPDERYLKRRAANCYTRKIFSKGDNPLDHSMVNRAINLCKEIISLYPHSSQKRKIFLANIYAETNHNQAAADQIYADLLESDLDPKGKQMLFNYYAKFLHFNRNDSRKSIEYHMKAAEIPQQSPYREDSIRHLNKIKERRRSSMCGEIVNFLVNLQH